MRRVRLGILGAVGIVLLLVLGGRLGAVEPGKPSKSSVWVTALRAIGSHDPDPSVRNPDWLAERFLGRQERALIPDNYAILGLDQDYREAMKNSQLAGWVLTMISRTRFVDEYLQQAVAGGASQVVILGAGFDSRAYRFRELLRNVKVFEVDFGPTQEYKRRRVREVLGDPPPNLAYVPIDFTREKLGPVLRRAGYRMNRKAFFIWEGVTMYIPEESVLEILRFITGNAAPGSSVVFDHYSKSRIEELPRVNEATRLLYEMLTGWGEPMIFGLPDGAEREFIESTGLDLIEHMPRDGPEEIQRYFTRKDGSRVGDVPWPPPQFPLGRPTRWLAVAAVPASKGSRSY